MLGVVAGYVALAFESSPIVIGVLSFLIIIIYVVVLNRYVLKKYNRPRCFSKSDLFIQLKWSDDFLYSFSMATVTLLILLFVFFSIGFTFSISSAFPYLIMLTFLLLHLYALFYSNKNGYYFLCFTKFYISSHLFRANTIYYNDIKRINTNKKKSKIYISSKNGNIIIINLRNIKNDDKIKTIEKVQEIRQNKAYKN